MSKQLESFIRNNRDAFDSEEPDPLLWNKLDEQLNLPGKPKRMPEKLIYRFAIATALAGVVVMGVLYQLNDKPEKAVSVAQTSKPGDSTANADLLNEINPNYAKEVYHFTQLIEIKQSELKQIEKEQPQLYRQFLSEITRLDSSYNALRQELPENPNREQLLGAMIQNLRLQTELLNQQLQVMQKIKQSKNKNDESNSKSI